MRSSGAKDSTYNTASLGALTNQQSANMKKTTADIPRRAPAPFYTVIMFLLLIPTIAMAIEEPKYAVAKKDQDFEIRLYGPVIVAETVVDTSDFDEASNEGFRRLAGYIFGGNRMRQKIEMTAPVTTEQSQKIAMTAPVESEQLGRSMRVAFTMPSEYTLESLPVPNDSRVTLRRTPARKFATIRFSGRWTEANFREHTDQLMTWIQKEGMKVTGAPIVARYNPPFIPSFLRRNEILIPVE
jgi:effector-binding domain-containing protein